MPHLFPPLPPCLLPLLFRGRFGGRARLGSRLCRESDVISIFNWRGLVEDVAYEGCGTCIHELVLGTRRHDHEVSSFDVLVFPGYCSFSRSGCKCQSLINGVDLSLSALPLQLA